MQKVVNLRCVRALVARMVFVNSICRHLLFVCEIAFDMATELPTRSLAQTQRIKQCALACADCERRWKREKESVSLSLCRCGALSTNFPHYCARMAWTH